VQDGKGIWLPKSTPDGVLAGFLPVHYLDNWYAVRS